MVELTRLHTLYVAVPSKFSWRNTPTSLVWMNAMRDRLREEPPAAVPALLAGQGSRCWETASQGDLESQAEDHSALTHPCGAGHARIAVTCPGAGISGSHTCPATDGCCMA